MISNFGCYFNGNKNKSEETYEVQQPQTATYNHCISYYKLKINFFPVTPVINLHDNYNVF